MKKFLASFSPLNHLIKFPVPLDPCIVIFNNIKEVYIINLWLFLRTKLREKVLRGPQFLGGNCTKDFHRNSTPPCRATRVRFSAPKLGIHFWI